MRPRRLRSVEEPAGATLRLKDVTRVFGSPPAEVRAVDGVNLDVSPGEIVLVMGPSGAGKTTLLALCGGLLRPTSGSVWLDDTELTALNERKLPRVRLARIGFVFQSFNLLANLTAIENVALVLETAGWKHGDAMARAASVLESLRLGARLEALPETMSGGEKQRVAIARALVADPALVLADEPTGNLDSRTGYEVVHMLESIARQQGKTVVIVTHDQRIADIADRVLWLEDGHLTEGGSEDAILVRDPVCGMAIDVLRAEAHRNYDGRVVHFCSQRCLTRFEADPAHYVGRPVEHSG